MVEAVTKQKKYSDPDWLYEQHHERELTVHEIAEKTPVPPRTIRWMLMEHDIEVLTYDPRTTGKKYHDLDWLRATYIDERWTIAEIADECNVSPETVRQHMAKHDIDRRDASDYASHKSNDTPCFWTDKDEGYEYWSHAHTMNGYMDQWQVAVHRLLASLKYSLDEMEGMHIHHKNHIPWDNRLTNLELKSPQEHSKHHATDRGWEIDV